MNSSATDAQRIFPTSAHVRAMASASKSVVAPGSTHRTAYEALLREDHSPEQTAGAEVWPAMSASTSIAADHR
ncbi:MAG: hypothetical protein R3F04_08540 [Lysobacteraceae bacterium]